MESLILALIVMLAIPLFGLVLDGLMKILFKVLSEFTSWHFAYILVTRLTFIGVIHHELAHALFRVLTGAKIKKINLFKPQGDQLGSVDFYFRGNFILIAIQRAMTAIAPTVCGAITSSIIIFVLSSQTLPLYAIILLVYSLVSIVIHMTMSKQDIKVMLKGYPIVFLLVYLVVSIVRM